MSRCSYRAADLQCAARATRDGMCRSHWRLTRGRDVAATIAARSIQARTIHCIPCDGSGIRYSPQVDLMGFENYYNCTDCGGTGRQLKR